MRKKVLIAAAAGALALAAGLVLVFTQYGNLRPAGRYAAVYEKGSRNLFVALPEGSFPLRARDCERQVFAGQSLFYDAVTDSGTDIYWMDLRSSRSRKEGGALIAQGARGGWSVTAQGKYALWIAARGSVLQCYDVQRGALTELASGVDALYAAPGNDTFFFTKAEGELFRCNLKLGQRPERMAGGVSEVRFFGGEAQAIVFYLVQAGAGHDLYALAREGAAVLVAQDPAAVLYDHYELGGNLYFLKRGAGAAGALALDDPHRESDENMKEPQKPNANGIISGWLANALGANAAYQREKAAWDKKLERDLVRAAALEAMESLPGSGIPMDCYVYDGAGARLLAGGVREDRIALLRPLGRPAMLYEKQRPTEGGGAAVPLDDLVAAFRSGGADAVREVLLGFAGGDTDAQGYAVAMMAPSGSASEGPLEPDFGRQAGWEAFFLPGSETMLCQERDVAGGLYSLYSYELTDYALSERGLVDLGVQDVTPLPGGGVYYRKQEADAQGVALYYLAPGSKPARAMQSSLGILPAGDGLLAFDGAGALHAVTGAQARKLDDGARPESLHTGEAHVCYLTGWEAGAGTLRLFHLGDKGKNAAARTLDTGVTAIRTVR